MTPGTGIRIETVDTDGLCLWGWPSPEPCSYTGGCACAEPLGHPGLCKCPTCGSRKKRPGDWDATGREEANR